MMRKLTTVVLFVVIALLSTGAARASEQSELLYARGLVLFHKESYKDALALFDQAVQADPQDTYALYYRGVTQGRLGNYPAAVTDLRGVMKAKPELDQGALELGVALTQTGEYKEALPWLEQAQTAAPSEAEASFFLGLAQLRLGQLDAARTNFANAAKQDPALGVSSSYYQGVTEYQAHNLEAARQHFDSVVQANPTSEMGREASGFLTAMSEGKQAAAEVGKPYQLYGSVGFQYDSNLGLISDEAINENLGKKKEDGRATLMAGGAYAPWRGEHTQVTIGYEFFQSLHFHETEYNLQNHRLNAQLLGDVGPVQLGLLGRYDFFLLTTDGFLQQGTAIPWVTVPEGNFGRTEVFFRLRWRDFTSHDFDFSGSLPVDFNIRDSLNYSPGFRQFVYLGAPDRYLTAGYRYDHEDPSNSDGDRYGYDGQEVGAGIGWALPFDIGAEALYTYHYEDYAHASGGRQDDVHQVVAAATRPITDHLDATVAYFGLFNESNQSLYQYDRSIVSVSVGVRF